MRIAFRKKCTFTAIMGIMICVWSAHPICVTVRNQFIAIYNLCRNYIKSVLWSYEISLYPCNILCRNILIRTSSKVTHMQKFVINILWCSNVIWRRKFGSTMVQIMDCFPTASSHYLKQFMINDACWQFMMTSSNRNIFRVTGHLCGEFNGPRLIPRTKASDVELWCLLWSATE